MSIEASSPFLSRLLSQPTAPFREGHAIETVRAELEAQGIPYFQDRAGNLVLGVGSAAECKKLAQQKSDEPLRVFIAHLDHPGFHGTAWSKAGELQVSWLGGSPFEHLEGAPVWLADRAGWVSQAATLHEVKLTATGKSIETAVVRAPELSALRRRDATEFFGGFRFRETHWLDGDLIYTKAADDLIGSYAICEVARRIFTQPAAKRATGKRPPFIGLLTRGEEVGFIGAIAHFNLGYYEKAKRSVLAVSLETSRALPAAEIGKGPIVRLGDRYTVFSANHLRVFQDIAQRALPDRHQKRIMDGGSCEASAATVFGIPAIGISVPLGNYHNQSFEGGPDSRGPNGPAPEFVHRQDLAGLLTLCDELLKPGTNWAQPWAGARKDFKARLAKYGALLKSSP